MEKYKRILVAMDNPSIDEVKALFTDISPYVGGIKLGLEFFNHNGLVGVNSVIQSSDDFLFLDLKFHDIPNTVAGAIRGAMNCKPNMLNIHISGGLEMMQRAKQEVIACAKDLDIPVPLLIGVTILTSLNEEDLSNIGYTSTVKEQIIKMAKLAKQAGLDGVVCSALEIKAIRESCGEDFVLVVPGIRPLGSVQGDQKRVMTPLDAIDSGADYIVIGRPITNANSPLESAKSIKESLS